jgi:DoxX-like family
MNKLKYVYWIATGLLCLGYLGGAALYTFNHAMVAEIFPKLGYPVYLTYLLPVVKVLGPVAILSRYSVALSDLAYAGMFYHLPLAFSAHVTSGEPGWQPAAIMFILLLVSFFTQNAARKPQSLYAGTRFGTA